MRFENLAFNSSSLFVIMAQMYYCVDISTNSFEEKFFIFFVLPDLSVEAKEATSGAFRRDKGDRMVVAGLSTLLNRLTVYV